MARLPQTMLNRAVSALAHNSITKGLLYEQYKQLSLIELRKHTESLATGNTRESCSRQRTQFGTAHQSFESDQGR